MYIDINEYHYQKTKTNDGLTHIACGKPQIGYMVSVSKNYINCEDENEMKRQLVQDLIDEAIKLNNELLENKTLTKHL